MPDTRLLPTQSSRRKQVKCLLCGQHETRDDAGVCPECRQLIKDGEAFRRLKGLQETGDLETSRTALYFRLYHREGVAGTNSDLRADWQDAALALTGGEREYVYHQPAAWRELPPAQLDSPKIGSDSTDDTYILCAPVGRAALLLKLYQATVDLLATAYAEGRRDGESFITRMVDGELTINQTLDPATRRAGR